MAGGLGYAWYSYDQSKAAQQTIKVAPGKAASFSQADTSEWNKKVLQKEAADIAAGVRKPDT